MELGEAVLQLVVDGKQYSYSLQQAKEKAEDFDDSTKDTGKSTQKQINALSDAFKNVGIAISAATAFSTKLLNEWAKSEAASTRLSAAVRIVDGAYEGMSLRLEVYADNLQKTTGFEDEQLKTLMAQAVTLGRTEAQVTAIADAATNLANAGIMPLDQAFTQLNLSYEGSIRLLGRMFPELKNLTQEELANGDAVSIIAKNVTGMNEAMMKTTEGGLRSFKNAFSELLEGMGQVIALLANSEISAGTGLLNKLADFVKSTTNWRVAQAAFDRGIATDAQKITVYDNMIEQSKKKIGGMVDEVIYLRKTMGGAADGLIVDLNKEIKAEQDAMLKVMSMRQQLQQKLKPTAPGKGTGSPPIGPTSLNPFQMDIRGFSEGSAGAQASIDQMTNAWVAMGEAAQAAWDKIKAGMDDMANRWLMLGIAMGGVQQKAKDTSDETNRFSSDTVLAAFGTASDLTGRVSAVFDQASADQLSALDNWYQAEKQRIEQTIVDEASKNEAMTALDDEYNQKKRQAVIDDFNLNKTSAIGQAIINTASAVIKALPNIPLAIAVGALGGVQLGLIMAQQPPALEKGGNFTVPPGYDNDTYYARFSSGEHVSVTPAGEEGQVIQNIMILDGRVLAEWFTKASANRQVLTHARSVI